MKYRFTALLFLLCSATLSAQVKINTEKFNRKSEASFSSKGDVLELKWPVGNGNYGIAQLNMRAGQPLFQTISIGTKAPYKTITSNVDPAFLLSIGKRDLVSQNGWNIFFDKVPLKPFKTFPIVLEKTAAKIASIGSRTIITISSMHADRFEGDLEITFYNGSPMFNVAAVMSTKEDATAIVYDAGLIDKSSGWKQISWINTDDKLVSDHVNLTDTATNIAVKYRAIAAATSGGTLAIFPAPHQYFYPLDEAFNLKFTWRGSQYRKMLDGYGIGIRQDLKGDNRFVPWFNAPPDTKQRLNFFCYLGSGDEASTFADIKKFTHNDSYVKLPGFKTMSSHFHNEFVMKVMMANKELPEVPDFVKVFKNTGIDIVHLAEFHYTAHPQGPDDLRLLELKKLFEMCRKYSDDQLLLLPGEEPNEFFGGHWLEFFPKEVYWIMSRKQGVPLVENHPVYGKVYHIGDKADMLKLLELEAGLAWTAHARTKGSVNAPDVYKEETFFKSDRFMGAAWKAMPADLSQPRLGKRVLDLLDDMNNWGEKKTVITEADLFTITPENEMYAHLNVNYLMMDKLPNYKDGWQPVLTAMQKGKFFSTTGEVLMPQLTVNNKLSGETIQLDASGLATVKLKLNWTFPLNFIEVISGDGTKVYRDKIDLTSTKAFGDKLFQFKTKVAGRKWLRLEAWDIAANGAFSQTFYIGK
ncbi:CehA/McbA family metallohydrolase domain-containing protein [Pedobacter sp. PWIIR3]